ncbi:hypothetical protein KSP39_PZI015496 [Platanthera zijinensis]|uniref:UV-B-induced protein At3g17800, chloroplastic-like n=1 Tax=Platanthera zijinensis TaxID=2320716 RepID=A0AAP0G1G4_9ASPA
MEAVVHFQSAQFLSRTTDFVYRSSVFAAHSSLDGKSRPSDGFMKRCWSIKGKENMTILRKGKLMQTIRASVDSSSGPSDSSSSSSSQLAPLQFESPAGQFLSQILLSHPHLVPAAVDQQLEQLLADLESEKKQDELNSTGTELVLYRRIAEVKLVERKKALEEILYAFVVQKFVDADVSLVPSIPQSAVDPNKVGHWPSWEEKFQKLHSSEAYEMIRNHLSVVLGNRVDDTSSVASISKFRVGQVYAASVLYGYFLRRVDRRFQLDKSMKTLPWVSEDDSQSPTGMSMEPASAGSSPARILHPEMSSSTTSASFEILQKFASLRSKEAFSIIEKHREALFGRTDVTVTPQGTVDSSKDDLIKLSFSGLKRLILEAVTFGSFLWDVESYVDSRYHFVISLNSFP